MRCVYFILVSDVCEGKKCESNSKAGAALLSFQEQELKLAADAVLCEVRKKQSDVKRMQDILRSLEKLRKLRKEAASRKCE